MAGYKAIEKLLNDLKKQRRMINIELCRMPQGKLMISSNGSRLSCFDIGSPNSRKNPKGIGRDKERVCKLARKAYLQEELERIEINIRQLEHALARCVPLDEADLLKSMPKHFDTLDVRHLVNPAVQNTGKWPNPSRDPSVKPGYPALRRSGLNCLTGRTRRILSIKYTAQAEGFGQDRNQRCWSQANMTVKGSFTVTMKYLRSMENTYHRTFAAYALTAASSIMSTWDCRTTGIPRIRSAS